VNNVELLSGGEMLVRFLRDEGVKYIYGYPGGALLHVYDALFKEPEVSTSWFVTNRLQPIWLTVMPVPPARPVWYW
jgi:hypothetical protein